MTASISPPSPNEAPGRLSSGMWPSRERRGAIRSNSNAGDDAHASGHTPPLWGGVLDSPSKQSKEIDGSILFDFSDQHESSLNPDMMFQLHLDRNLLSVYDNHIKKVVEIADALCGEFGGDGTIVRLASWLHDIATLKAGTKKDHHITGAKEAGKILRALEYGEDIIKSVQHCIECHSGSTPQSSRTIEAEIVRSADGIANLKYPPLLFFFAFSKKGLDFNRGMDAVKRKVESSFSKISDFAKHKAQDDYERWINVFS